MKEFELPDYADTYIHTVKDRCVDLINHKIWTGIKVMDLRRWFNNFDNEKERYFSACILDHLIFRSEDQVDALAVELFTKKLPNKIRTLGFEMIKHDSFLKLLRGDSNSKIRLVSVALKNERPVKSANLILRGYRRNLGLNDNFFIFPEEVEKEIGAGISTFIFVDDFLGTGDQFSAMWKQYGFSIKLSSSNVIYAPLVAHQSGIENMNGKCSQVEIVYAEYLNTESNVFESAFNDGVNSPESAKTFYDELLKKNKLDVGLLSENKYGHGCLGLAYTFCHSSPDNCLHIIWDKRNGWHPLIPK